MASDTVPAAVPSPNDPPAATGADGPQKGLLASMVSPVGPARGADFDLAPATGGADGEQHVTGASSDDYHADGNTQVTATKTTSTNSRQETRVWRAWLLAGAERWRKGGDERLKRLDAEKARHQANQVKEVRTINRAEKFTGGSVGGGSSNTSGGGKGGSGKTPGSKTEKNSPSTGTKNANTGVKNGPNRPAGRSGSGGNGGASGSGSGGGAGRSDKGSSGGSKANTDSGRGKDGGKGSSGGSGSGKPSSGKDSSSSSKGSGSGTSSSGADGKSGSGAGKTDSGKSAGGGKGASGSSGGSGAAGKPGAQGPAGKPGSDARPEPNASKGADGKGQDRKDATASTGKTDTGGKPNLTKPPAADPSKTTGQDQKTDGKTDPNAPAKKQDDDKAKPAGQQPDPAKDAGKPLTFRESRETGYRDGTRAARVTSHVRAYGHGFRDGYTDTTHAADRDKTRLDQAHEQRKQDRKDQPVTTPGTVTDQPKTTSKAQPIPVSHVNAAHVYLGDGASRYSLSRGEVRSLKGFERRLAAKADTMTKVAEATRGLKAHADEQSRQVTQLLEQAKTVKGGDKLIGELSRLADAAKAQAGKAEETHKRATRAAEACRSVLANVQTRYGGIYQAVVDSPETKPAELAYYKDQG